MLFTALFERAVCYFMLFSAVFVVFFGGFGLFPNLPAAFFLYLAQFTSIGLGLAWTQRDAGRLERPMGCQTLLPKAQSPEPASSAGLCQRTRMALIHPPPPGAVADPSAATLPVNISGITPFARPVNPLASAPGRPRPSACRPLHPPHKSHASPASQIANPFRPAARSANRFVTAPPASPVAIRSRKASPVRTGVAPPLPIPPS